MEQDLTKPYLGTRFIGLDNYAEFFIKDSEALTSLQTSFVLSISVVIVEFAFGLGLALLLHRNLRGKYLMRTLLILPMVITPVVAGLTWRIMFSYNYGIINYVLDVIGLGFLARAWIAEFPLASIIVADAWQWTPFVTLIFLAGLEAIPVEPFEAAKVDGASSLQIFRHITLPLLRPMIALVTAFRIMDSLKTIDLIYVMTGGGPARATEIVPLYAYIVGFARSGHITYTSTMGIIMLIFTIIIVEAYIFLAGKEIAV